MELSHVSFESHRHGATIYVAGVLGHTAAIRTEEIVRTLSREILAVRLDLRAVDYIDPDCFVRVARAVRRWCDACNGRVNLEFPARSERRRWPSPLADQPKTIGIAVTTAMSCPMSTSPG